MDLWEEREACEADERWEREEATEDDMSVLDLFTFCRSWMQSAYRLMCSALVFGMLCCCL